MTDSNFLMETRLRDLDESLHRKYKDCVAVMSIALDRYQSNFPLFTDHSLRHSLDVIDFCNLIVGEENITLMNADEIFVLLMSVFLHDFGMGIAENDYHKLMPEISREKYEESLTEPNFFGTIRKYHHELSAKLIEKYAPLFDIDDPTYIHAIAQVAKGHRVTDLLNTEIYPVNYKLSTGSEICLPYLAALIRLSDEIDIGRNRNPINTYGYHEEYDTDSIFAHSIAEAVRCVDVEKDAFIVIVDQATDEVYESLMKESVKINRTLNQCIEAVNGRTKFRIYQDKVIYNRC